MRQVAHLDLDLLPVDSPLLFGCAIRPGVASVHALDSRRIRGLLLYQDIFGRPLAAAQVTLPRDMRTNFITTLGWFVASFLLGMLAIGLLTMTLLQRLVLQRLSALHDHLTQVEKSRELTRRVPETGHDEVSRLSKATNHLLQSLQEDLEARERLTEERRRMDEQVRRMQKFENLGVLAGGIAHDFNNLLAGLFSYLEVGRIALARGELDRARVCLDKCAAVGHRATDLTQQLLTFSKGGAPLKRVADLGSLLKREVEFSLSGSGIRPRFALAEDLWLCSMDENQIAQVIDNLVINARQAMPGDGTLLVAAGNLALGRPLSPSLGEGPYAWVSISDQGMGIPTEVLPRIFDPFFTTKSGGTGLGLAIAFRVLERHDGTITVANNAQGGAIFTFYLPALPKAMRSEIRPGALGVAAAQPAGTGRILVMDDEADVRDSLVMTLETLGYQAQSVADGRAALAAWQHGRDTGQPFRAVIMDLTIPGGMGGREAMAQLLRIDPAARGIVSSGYTEEDVLQDIRQYGFLACLQKPYDIAQLRETLRTVLGQ
jgi:signal transduction histidine kinase/ActR/RegA family two-component response regulator